MTKVVDSYRFLDPLTQTVIKSWIARETPRPIPWTLLKKPLSECTIALISSAGIALKTDRPFDQEGERRNPWWGDPTFRILPSETTAQDVGVYHLHIDPRFGLQDLNCLLPLQRLKELEQEGVVGRVAPHHYSIMGYILEPRVLLEETTPAIIQHLCEEQVDVVLLFPT